MEKRGKKNHMNVLVAEKDAVCGSRIEGLIQQWGYNVDCAHSEQEILNLARKKRVDIVLLETSLPHEKLSELIKELKEIDPEIRIVTMTPANSGDMEKNIRKLGIAYYMTKPFPDEELKSILDHNAKETHK
ncbi:response regulator [Thermodesulfobacteriota bacterium]